MKKLLHQCLGCVSFITLASLGVTAQAAPVLSTNAQFFVGGSLVTEDPKSGPPPATIGSLVTTPDGGSVDLPGNAFANAVTTSGIGAVRADGWFWSGGVDERELRAKASFGESVTNTSGSAQSYFYDFNVFGPRLEIADYVYGPDATIQYDIQVRFNGATIWNSSATLVGGQPGFTLTQTGTDLGATFFCLSAGCSETVPGNRFGYTFGNFSDQLSLGSIADGDSFTIETIMDVSVSALPYELGGLALIGDPSNIGANPGISGSVGVVPVPAAVWLFGSGLLGLIAIARRKTA